MKLYEERLATDRAAIRDRVAAMAVAVRAAVNESVCGLEDRDHARLYKVILDDHPINRESRAVDTLCHAFVARHLPAAGHLRFVSSVLRLNIALERIGDYAVTICRVGVQLARPVPSTLLEEMRGMADQAIEMLQTAMKAFFDADADLGLETKRVAKEIDELYSQIFHELVDSGDQRSDLELVRLLTIFDQLERVSDQAKNICDEAVFVATGKSKAPKVYKVHFVDETNSLVSPLAVAMARKAFPESGSFSSAGFQPADAVSPALSRTADRLGLDVEGLTPSSFADDEALSTYHVIVLLQPNEETDLPDIPFRSILLRWGLGEPPSGDDTAVDARLDELTQDLRTRIRDLMVTLRGEDAS